MELAGFAIVFLACMGIAKIINVLSRRLVVNGAAIYLALALAFVAWNVFMAWNSKLEPFQVGYVFGRNIAPMAVVAAVAVYYVFKFRSDKVHDAHVKRMREQRASAEA